MLTNLRLKSGKKRTESKNINFEDFAETYPIESDRSICLHIWIKFSSHQQRKLIAQAKSYKELNFVIDLENFLPKPETLMEKLWHQPWRFEDEKDLFSLENRRKDLLLWEFYYFWNLYPRGHKSKPRTCRDLFLKKAESRSSVLVRDVICGVITSSEAGGALSAYDYLQRAFDNPTPCEENLVSSEFDLALAHATYKCNLMPTLAELNRAAQAKSRQILSTNLYGMSGL